MKNEGAKKGLNLNIKKTKIIRTEKIHNLIKEMKTPKLFLNFAYLGSVTNSSGNFSQKNQEKVKTWKGRNG